MNPWESLMKWIGVRGAPPEPIVPPMVEQEFLDADRRNREASVKSRLSNRKIRYSAAHLGDSAQERTIEELIRRLGRSEYGEP